ncbi:MULTISPECIES: DEAD/DEAH box helicase [unclassified Sphingomonas]|uniref:DEAD/DEAH box helicase n=1 Tax=unclassified Sphingomonas TaxID=196159 RepID=UPI000E7437D8|nr:MULTISPECIES: DEAD/DEAH box helicase [unclassified Sphingomonas]RKE53660.1 superfamily II DNA/RNA helicase [Sphingomonas sp. PP-CC-1A-547]TCM10154.1 superfamily II DNA/RNA helicase [Sphingomonas sp. PP-CC-3G-468]
MSFADLGLSDELLKAVTDSGYTEPTPIQAGAIPSVLMMRDIIGIAQTGTGKTASFVLPMIDILAHGRSRARMPRSLILEPTRELAAQVAENFEKYGVNSNLSMALLIGGVSMGDQLAALEKGVDVLIATPGRLMDLFGRGKIMLNGCSMLVIDEADRMLDMGFIPDIEEICTKLPKQRQTLLFSATMPPPIKKLADKFLTNPKTIEVSRPASTNLNIKQYLVPVPSQTAKRDTLRRILAQEEVTNAIIFCNRKTTVRDLNKVLKQAGYKSGEIHGDMEQPQRLAELELFKSGAVTILVASDVAARGLDIKGVSTVFNYDAPWHPDDYVHRIGRTGRAGATGTAYTFVAPDDAENIVNIEKLTGQTIERLKVAEPKTAPVAAVAEDDEVAPRRDRSRNRRSGRLEDVAPDAAAVDTGRERSRTRRVPREDTVAPAVIAEVLAAVEPVVAKRPRWERTPIDEPVPAVKPRVAEPTRVEPVQVEPAYVEPEYVEPVRTAPVRSEPVQTEPVRSEPVRSQAVRSEVAKVEPPRTERIPADPTGGRRQPVADTPADGWNGPFPSFLNAVIGGYE